MHEFKSLPEWGDFDDAASRHPYLKQLFARLKITGKSTNSVAWCLRHRSVLSSTVTMIPSFVDQVNFTQDARYYEQIIAASHQIPTRESSWHDFFNGVIWQQFPNTKAFLNKLHMKEIRKQGLHPRTLVRNQVTHFDECGLVLVGIHPDAQHTATLLSEHQWKDALLDRRDGWGSKIFPIVFGHANLEMLLNPFLNLTAKWVFLDLTDRLTHCDLNGVLATTDNEVISVIDQHLCNMLQVEQIFSTKGRLKPLPLLGIPAWHPQQDDAFYAQTNVFRPKRRSSQTDPIE